MSATHQATHATASHDAHDAHDAHAHPSTRTYINIFGVLFIVTAAEVAAAQVLPLVGLASLVVPSLLIMAVAKGAMIMMYYMHLKSDSVWFTVPMAFGLILGAGMLISMIGLFIGSPRAACTPELGKGCVAAAAK
jgi:cytochrome c oxidase subunit 4/cytochrome o ubiquinol oxidase operon protein cyoD